MSSNKSCLKYLGFLVFIFASCNNLSQGRYSGYKKVIDVENIQAVSGKPVGKIIDLNIPAEDNLFFDYNERMEAPRFVMLEETANSKIGKIDKIFLTENRIIIADFKIAESVFIFDAAGRFINKITVNKELTRFIDVAYYYSKKEIILHDDNDNKSFYFDNNGNFRRVEKEYISFFCFDNLRNTDNFVYMDLYTQNNHIPILTTSDIYLGNTNTRISYVAPNAIQRIKIKSNYHYRDNLSSSNGSPMFYTPVFSDTIYAIDGKELNVYPKFVLHFPGPDIIGKIRETGNDIDMPQLTGWYNSHKYYSFQGKVLSTQDSVYYIECNKDQLLGYFYSGKTNKIIGGNIRSVLTYKDSAKTEFYQYPVASINNEFVSILAPEDLKIKTNILRSANLSKVYDLAESNHNPVLVFYKLKTF